MKELQLRNRQRDHNINSPLLRVITRALLEDLLHLGSYELAIHFVSARIMAQTNRQFLQHEGPTDVITFDLKECYELPSNQPPVAGEIFICPAVAETQAKAFSSSRQSELVRYVVHGVLHLLGYDDLVPEKRKIMKREENRLVRLLERRFEVAQLAR